MNRFNDTILTQFPKKVELKCFNPIPIDPYLDYMEKILQPKRIVGTYIHRETNTKRKKAKECIHQNSTLKAQVESYLIKNVPIFRFCNKCMATAEDRLF